MKTTPRCSLLAAAALGGLFLLSTIGRAHAQATKPDAPPKPATHTEKKSTHSAKASHAVKESDLPDVNLLDAARAGAVMLDAEGMGDGRMAVIVTNSTNRPLKVVLPPGLVASGATGQMMGMGGMGGMGGGMGGMGGGMGGMGGGMGGMGGGMGGMGGGMGGGMMGGRGGMSGGTMPASMGMMTLGRLIMFLIGDMSSWNFRSIMMGGMMGGMGMGMGGMGGGMGGMMGGMGGGMRSVPPTGQPFAVVHPGKTLRLPTRLVSLGGPSAEGTVAMPAQGEKLTLGDIGQLARDPRVAEAVRRLAAEKAPTVASQLVLWNVAAGLDWDVVARMSAAWADPRDVALARRFVASLDAPAAEDTGRIFVKVEGDADLAAAVAKFAKEGTLLGLKVETTLPDAPDGPSLALTIVVSGSKEKAEAALRSSNGRGQWVDLGKLTLPVPKKDGKLDVPALADAVVDGLLAKVFDTRLVMAKKAHGKEKETYTLRILNRSPLILNGVALAGAGPIDPKSTVPGVLSGLSVGPGKVLAIAASAETVERLGLKKGVHILAADLSGL